MEWLLLAVRSISSIRSFVLADLFSTEALAILCLHGGKVLASFRSINSLELHLLALLIQSRNELTCLLNEELVDCDDHGALYPCALK